MTPYPFYALGGILPSVIWLLFYLREDAHPESNSEIVKVFLYGMLAALVAIFLELWGKKIFLSIPNISSASFNIVQVFIGGALIEEYMKYLVIKLEVLRNPELDEPLDIMLYMIISALGFAASENILLMFAQQYYSIPLGQLVEIVGLRFLTATFLHALCSGILGYFLAMSFYKLKFQKRTFFAGLGIASILHGLYNLSIMDIARAKNIILPFAILVAMAIIVSFLFKKLKKMKGVCLIAEK